MIWEIPDQYGWVNRVYPDTETLQKETLAYADRVATNWLRDPMRIRTAKFSVNHMIDQMGFSAEIDAAYQSYFIDIEVRDTPRPRDEKGGIANVAGALKNLEASKEWLERMK